MNNDLKTINKKLYGARINRGRSSGPDKTDLDRYIGHLRRGLRKLLAPVR